MNTKQFFENILAKWQEEALSWVGNYVAIPGDSGLIVRYLWSLYERDDVTITTTVSFSRNVDILDGSDAVTFRIFQDDRCTNIVHLDPIKGIGRTELSDDMLGDVDCALLHALMELIGIDYHNYDSTTAEYKIQRMEELAEKYCMYDLTTEEGVELAKQAEANEFTKFIKGIIDDTIAEGPCED